MSRLVAVYPGSFDPVTNGHLDIIQRAASVFGGLRVVVVDNPSKAPLFTRAERVEMLTETTRAIPGVQVDQYAGLLADYARQSGARVVVKGLRALSDFDWEFQQALANRELDQGLETFLMVTNREYSYLSSSLVKELARWGRYLPGLVPPVVQTRLQERLRSATGRLAGKDDDGGPS